MTLTQLNYILAVDRCRNFAQAAKECFVTQPTLSMQIQKLEDYLQIIIFDRSKTPVSPTPMGLKVLDYARKIIQNSKDLEELSRSIRGEVSGEFILAVIPTLAPYVLPMFIKDFINEFPKVELKVFEQHTGEITRMLEEGKIDAAILAAPLGLKNISEQHLFYEPFKIFLSSDHVLLKKKALDEKDLNLSEAWLLKEGHCLRNQALQLCHTQKENQESRLFFEGGSLETLINMVKSSYGFTVLPYLATRHFSPNDKKLVRDFKNHIPVRDICFVTGPMSLKKSIEKALVSSILKNVPKELRKDFSSPEIISIK